MNSELKIRPVTHRDESLLFQIFADSRPDIRMASHLPEELRAQLLRSQYDAQTKHYRTQFRRADFGIIEFRNQPVGRLFLDRSPKEILIIDLAILEEFQGQGIGSVILQAIIEEAKLDRKPVRLHVEKQSRALSFYRAHGFVCCGEKPLHYEMTWIQDSQTTEPQTLATSKSSP